MGSEETKKGEETGPEGRVVVRCVVHGQLGSYFG